MSLSIPNEWIYFLLFFALFAKSLWFIYYSSLYLGRPEKKRSPRFKGQVGVVIPTYNEELPRLKDTLDSVVKAEGVAEIVVVNDGSEDKRIERLLEQYAGKTPKLKAINLPRNMGKRVAQKVGVEALSPKTDVYVFMDSDTVLEKDSVSKLTSVMSDETVGGVTATILVRNAKENFVTKAISAMYWSASHIWRQAPSNMGFVQVTNGQLSCYRGWIIRELMKKYTTQEFMGVNCTLSDDRYLTHHIQTEFGKKVLYVRDAVAYTYVPNTIKGAYKMFLRWKRGAWRESLLVLKHFRKKPLLVADIWANHAVQLMQTVVRLGVLVMAFYFGVGVLAYYLGVMVLISLLFGYHMIWFNPREVPYRVIYTILNEVFFSWTHIHALITIKKQGTWSTR